MLKTLVSTALLGLLVVLPGPLCADTPEPGLIPPQPHPGVVLPTLPPLPPPPSVSGAELFAQTCTGCHGQYGLGIAHLGKDLVHSAFVRVLSEEELVKFVERGRPVGDALNTTGVTMPPRGGNPNLDETQVRAIVQYVKTLHDIRLAGRE